MANESILKAVFERHLFVHFVDTEMFQPLVDYLVSHQKEAEFLEPNIIINELTQSNRLAEAKAVDKACRGQQGLSTFLVTILPYPHRTIQHAYRKCNVKYGLSGKLVLCISLQTKCL